MSYLSVFAILPYKYHTLEDKGGWERGRRAGLVFPLRAGLCFPPLALPGAGGIHLTKGTGMSQMKYKQIKPDLDLKEPTM